MSIDLKSLSHKALSRPPALTHSPLCVCLQCQTKAGMTQRAAPTGKHPPEGDWHDTPVTYPHRDREYVGTCHGCGNQFYGRKARIQGRKCQTCSNRVIPEPIRPASASDSQPNSAVAPPAAAPRPRAKSVKYANPHHPAGTSNAPSPERPLSLDRPAEAETRGTIRPLVRFTLFRVRLLDADAKYASVKDLLDGCCEAGLLPGDRDDQITLEVVQVKANAFKNEKTTIEITIP